MQRHGRKILGVLSGLDRMRFRGSLRPLTTVGDTPAWLVRAGVFLKDFMKFAKNLARRICRAGATSASAAGRRGAALRYSRTASL